MKRAGGSEHGARHIVPAKERDLFDGIASFAALHAAALRAVRGKRAKPGASAFLANLEKEVLRLERELRNDRYRPGRYKTIEIRDPKHRIVSATPFRDRVVHQAFCAVCEPVFERGFVAEKLRKEIADQRTRDRLSQREAEQARQRAALERESVAAWKRESGQATKAGPEPACSGAAGPRNRRSRKHCSRSWTSTGSANWNGKLTSGNHRPGRQHIGSAAATVPLPAGAFNSCWFARSASLVLKQIGGDIRR